MEMDSHSQETLRRVEENDAGLTKLFICGANTKASGVFTSQDGADFSRLGAAIGENNHLASLVVYSDAVALDVTNNEFYDGLTQNSSIHKLTLQCQTRNMNIAGGVGQKMLEAYQQNNNLTILCINDADLQNRGGHVIVTTLRRCTNLTLISLACSNITDEQILPMVEVMRGHRSLEYLNLNRNRIGNDGCETIATMLSDPISNLHTLHLANNLISVDGAVTLANGLANNTKLHYLYLAGNQINQNGGDIFNKLLCNKSSIKDTYFSNHTLQMLQGISQQRGDELYCLLKMNKCTNKSHVAIRKILKYHPNIDMEPFFEWNMEGEGERDLKALPYVLSWFDRAEEAVAGDIEGGDSYKIVERKLSAMYQFSKAMPLLFVPVPHDKGGDNKRKRDD